MGRGEPGIAKPGPQEESQKKQRQRIPGASPPFSQKGIESPEEQGKEEPQREMEELRILVCVVLIGIKDQRSKTEETKEKKDAGWPSGVYFHGSIGLPGLSSPD
jgi:hypothetical protein